LELQLIVISTSLYIFIQYFAIQCNEGSMLNKTRPKAFHWWPLNPG